MFKAPSSCNNGSACVSLSLKLIIRAPCFCLYKSVFNLLLFKYFSIYFS